MASAFAVRCRHVDPVALVFENLMAVLRDHFTRFAAAQAARTERGPLLPIPALALRRNFRNFPRSRSRRLSTAQPLEPRLAKPRSASHTPQQPCPTKAHGRDRTSAAALGAASVRQRRSASALYRV